MSQYPHNDSNGAIHGDSPLSPEMFRPLPNGFRDGAAPGTPAPGGSVWDYVKLIKRRKLALVAAALLGGIGGVVYLLGQKPVYQAATTIEVQGFNEAFMGMNMIDPQAGSGIYSTTQGNINTQLRIIESGSVRAPVVERLTRETAPMVAPTPNRWFDRIRKKLQRTPPNPLREMKGGLNMATATLKAKSVLGTRIIAITCDSTIPDIAANFVNTIASEYIAQSTQLRSTSTQKTSQWLESQLDENKIKLEQAEGRLQDFIKKSGITFTGDQDTLANSKLRQLTADLAGIQAARISKQSAYEMIKSKPIESIPDILGDANLRAYQAKLADLRREMAQLTSTYTPEHPKVKAIQAQITELQGTFEKERGNVVQRIENDYLAAKRQENLLISAYNGQAGAVVAQADKASEYALLKREVDIYRLTMNNMLQQVNQASVVSAVPASNIRVVDTAGPPGFPYKPDPTYTLALSTFLGLAAGFGLIVLLEGASKRKSSLTFGTPGYASTVLFIPELGVIPSAQLGDELGATPLARWKRARLPAALNPAQEAPETSVALSTWGQKPSLVAESFRLTLTSLTLMNRNGDRPRMLVVTSPGPGEGKTTVASNIAAAMAESGQQVLLIDMDLRRPQLHNIFNLTNDQGFTDMTRSGDLGKVDRTHPFISSTTIPGVFVLPSGSVDLTKISELFHSPRVPSLLKQLKQSFDTVIIDTPPMLQFSEARLVASFSDGVILVLRSGQTNRDSALSARDQLSRDGIAVLGTVLNDWRPHKGDINQYDAYYGSYKKYQEKDPA
ncbi:MAG: polysaccharide biosynthesis tyrosine autokinase [Terriglobia bacterium]